MTYEQLLLELEEMQDKDPEAMKDEVCLIFDLDTIQYIELVYRLGSGRLSFVATFMPENLSQTED